MTASASWKRVRLRWSSVEPPSTTTISKARRALSIMAATWVAPTSWAWSGRWGAQRTARPASCRCMYVRMSSGSLNACSSRARSPIVWLGRRFRGGATGPPGQARGAGAPGAGEAQEQSFAPGLELSRVEGLDHDVVGPRLEETHPLLDVLGLGDAQHGHRGGRGRAADLPADLDRRGAPGHGGDAHQR